MSLIPESPLLQFLLASGVVTSVIAVILGLIRTYINWKTLQESREYWRSWKERSRDITKELQEGRKDA